MTKLIAFGDSIFAGWDGRENIPANQRIPELIGQALGWEVTNTAISGAQFDDRDSGFPNMARTHSTAGYDYALVNFGVNNWCFPSGGLDYVERKVREGIDNLWVSNPQIKILLELPTQDFRNGSTTLFDTNSQGWSQNMLDNVLVKVAEDMKVDYYDWRSNPVITYANANETLGDGNTGVHPTPETSKKIAARLVDKFKEIMAGKPSVPDDPNNNGNNQHPDQPSKPNEPDKPNEPSIQLKELKIDRLSDPFKIADNIDEGSSKTVDRINDLYKLLAPIEGLEKPVKITKAYSSPGNVLTRTLRNYTILCTEALEQQVNELIKCYNKDGVISFKTFENTLLINLLRPDKLTLDKHYIDTINYNWFLIENKLNLLLIFLTEQSK